MESRQIMDFLSNYWWSIPVGIIALIILIKFVPRYRIAPPDTAFIISGLIRRSYKVRNPDGSVSARLGSRVPKGSSAFTE